MLYIYIDIYFVLCILFHFYMYCTNNCLCVCFDIVILSKFLVLYIDWAFISDQKYLYLHASVEFFFFF